MPIADALTRLRDTRAAREVAAFSVVGGLCFLLDLGLFQLLYAHVGVNAVGAKLASTLVSMTVAYVGHRYWSFAHRDRSGVRRSYSLFLAVNAATLLIGLTVVWIVRYPLGQESALVLQAANVASIGLGTVIRFTAYRRWVFPALATPLPGVEPRTAVPVPRMEGPSAPETALTADR